MILKNSYSNFNYRYILYLALTAILFVSCQNNDPLVYFKKESLTVGYKKIASGNTGRNYEFGENSILNIPDSLHNLSKIIPEISTYAEFEVYYSFFDNNNYSVLIVCNGLGEKLKQKIIYDKQISNFGFKEIYNEQNSFIAPLDENKVLISSSMEDIRKAIKRGEDKSILSNDIIKILKKEIPENSSSWFITTDNAKITSMALPVAKDSLSNIIKISPKFKSLIFFNNGNPSLLIDGEDSTSGAEISKNLKNEASMIDFNLVASKVPEYKFKSLDINNNNNKFRIIIK